MKTKSRKKGAILITAVVLATGLAIALGSFIALCVSTARLSNSSFNFNSALNLCDAGLEHAMVAINAGDYSWSSRSIGGATALTRTFGPFDLGNGMEGYADVAIFEHTSEQPRIVAQGRTVGSLGASITKQVEVVLRRRSSYETGLVAKETVELIGNNVIVDSYDSENPLYSTGGKYDAAKRKDGGSVASGIVKEVDTGVSLGNADVWGKVSTSGSKIVYKPNGSVLGLDSPTGIKVDPNRVTKNFKGSFFGKEAPTGTWTADYRAGDPIPATLGATGGSTLYRMENLSLSGNNVLTIQGDVTLVMPSIGSGDALSVTGNASIVLESGATLSIYVEGNVKIAGNGITNPGLPKDLRIFGTSDIVTQTIEYSGNGSGAAVIDAPNAIVTLGGGGSVGSLSGSVVAKQIKLNGHYPFHYDEALKRLGDGNPMRLGLWREITTAAQLVSF